MRVATRSRKARSWVTTMREGERGALRLAARGSLRALRGIEPEAVEEFIQLEFLRHCRLREKAFPQGRCRYKRGLLLDQCDAQAFALLELAVVERDPPGDDAEERGLAGAVAADQADALAWFEHQRGAIEERQLAVGEGGIGEGKERHAPG